MTDAPADVRLRATELQMRRALGLGGDTPRQPTPSPNSPNGVQSRRRHFVRDGEVPVTVIHRHDGHDIAHELDEARQALAAQTAAHEEAKRALADARTTIRDLETKLGHERPAKDEATQRNGAERRRMEEALATAQEELAAVRAHAERECDEATVAREAAEKRFRQMTVAKPAKDATAAPSLSTVNPAPGRRRGRPPKDCPREQLGSDDSGVVEWWVPGWQEKYR